MSGPIPALALAAILAIVPGFGWASGAVVALVALRKNATDAMAPLIGGLAVAMLVNWTAGDFSQAGLVIAAMAGALVLANSRSLAWALLASSAVSALFMVLVLNLAPGKIDQMVQIYQPMFDAWLDELKKNDTEGVFNAINVRSVVIEATAMVVVISSSAALLVARWLQAKLYNPGGFKQEFHNLRLLPVMSALLVLVLFVSQQYQEARVLLPPAIVPLLLAGLALVHGFAGRKPNNGPLLVFFYIGLVFSAGLGVMLLIAAAIMDSFADFRSRFQKRYE
ncbi:MAG: hypothetical protein MI808_15520 [Pseudomonadales bacterium]|nr:hypothetical protein [Pseudomonadales bacterium]